MERFRIHASKGKKIILFILISSIFFSCYDIKYPKTAKKYQNKTILDKSIYTKDSLYLIQLVKGLISYNIRPFRPENQFDSLTQIEIDTILYSPDTLKMTAFIVTKNANGKNPYMERPPGFHYNADFVLGFRASTDSLWRIIPTSILSMNYYKNKEKMLKRYHEYFFREVKATPKFEYNLDDIRFWHSSIWEMELKAKSDYYYTCCPLIEN